MPTICCLRSLLTLPPIEHRPNQFPSEVWILIWKVKVPQKIGNFVWKLMHDSLPTFLTLRNRRIPTTSTCPLCNAEDESAYHLFLYCTFARACWYGSPLAVHTSELSSTSVQVWVGNILIRYKQMNQDMTDYLQSIFTYLWTTWNHRNLEVHEGKTPNPMEVIPTAQTLSCRYKEAFNMTRINIRQLVNHCSANQRIGGPGI